MGWYNILSKLTIGASVLCESLQYLVNMSTELYVFLDSLKLLKFHLYTK